MSVDPRLRLKIIVILRAMDLQGFPMVVTAAARTQAEQVALYRQGRELVNGVWTRIPGGTTVTNADGILKASNHQVTADGFGRAVDCCFLVDGPDRDGELTTPSWDEKHPWMLYGVAGEAQGLKWGGRWTSPHDAPHLELAD